MTSEIPVTQARDELAELINRVAYGHERIILTRHSKAVACLVPPEDLARLQEQEGEQELPAVSYPAGTAPPASAHQPSAPGLMPVAARYRPPGQPRG
jgi:prevent-host-death family protein